MKYKKVLKVRLNKKERKVKKEMKRPINKNKARKNKIRNNFMILNMPKG